MKPPTLVSCYKSLTIYARLHMCFTIVNNGIGQWAEFRRGSTKHPKHSTKKN